MAVTPQGGPPVFTDDPLVVGSTFIRALHLTELRDAVNQARARAGLTAASWTDSQPLGVIIKAAHVTELRTRLNEARLELAMAAASYTDPGLGVGYDVKAVHIQELRTRVTEALATAVSIDGYLINFYQLALLRQPSGNESAYWNDIFRAAYQNGQGSLVLGAREFGRTIFESAEYAARNRSDHDYVYDLYKTYVRREPDQAGWDYWTVKVPLFGREHVRRGFDESTEFLSLMGTMSTSGSPSSGVSSVSSARVNPYNQPGSGLQARDAEWSLPLINLPGRAGLDLGLSLSYSSMVWTRSGPYIYFDEDIGSPSPGFKLGFPTIQEKVFDAEAGDNVYLLTTPGGRRVELRQVGTSNVYEAGDSSYLQLVDDGTLLVRSTDGTKLIYGWFNHEFRCTEIQDRNGNYITVNYNWLGDLTTVTDTLARTITFNYDTNHNLISITQSWTVNGAPQTHTWANFGWTNISIQSSFSGVAAVGAPNGTTIPVLSWVGLADSTRHTFEYNGAGQAAIIRSYRSDDAQRAYTAYDYQATGDDCPRLSATRVWAENWTGLNGVPAEVTTQYEDAGNGSHVITAPDGTVYKEFYGGTGASPVWQKGLPIRTEVWSGTIQKWTTLAWTQDNTAVNYQTNPRVTESTVNDTGNSRRTTVSYQSFTLSSGATVNLPSDTREYAADGSTILRRAHTTYRMDVVADVAYLDRHILGLAKEQFLYEINGGVETLMSRVGLQYDEAGSIQGTDAPVQHHGSYNSVFVIGRGNLSSVKRYDVNLTDGSHSVSSVRYNTAGSVVASIDALSHQTLIAYADSFSDGITTRNTLAYPTTLTDAGGNSSVLQYNFDFGARTRVQGPAPGGQPQGLIQTLTYDAAARLDRVMTTNNDAYKRYVYGPNYVQSFSTVNTVADEAYAIQVFDGVGQVIGAAGNHDGIQGEFSLVNTIYDAMGRAVKQSNPGEINDSWVPVGDDAAGLNYTNQSYDWKGRPLVTTNPGGSSKEATYSGCGCAGGAVITLTDEVGRKQKSYSDVLGRNVKTEVLNLDSSVYSATVNTYNGRDQITQVLQHAGPEGSATFQTTTMTYDGHGRLKTKHLPEQNTGVATTWDYNLDDTIQKVTDARGANSTFGYNSRHLVTSITYDAPSGIPVPAAASFAYDAVGNRTSMADGTGTLTYQYNTLSQLTSETRQFSEPGAPSSSYSLSYQYNLAGELKKITDPTNVTINYNHDAGGRIVGVTGENNLVNSVSQYASNFVYRAWGAVRDKDSGNGGHAHVDYNARLLPTTAVLTNNPTGTMTWNYDYYADGRLQHAYDVADNRFDRLQDYDHTGRLKEAYSGREARGLAPTTPADSPYRQSMQYDVWNNMTSKSGRFWRGSQSDSSTYINNRRQFWSYDAEGNVLGNDGKEHTYDSVGKQTQVRTVSEIVGGSGTGHPQQSGWEIAQSYDAAGKTARRIETRRTEEFIGEGPETNITETVTTTFYLYSSVLGAKVVELDAAGVKTKGFVYANGERLAKQEINPTFSVVWWHHANPGTNSWVEVSEGGVQRQEMDPMGAEVGTSDPYINPGQPLYKDIQPLPQQLFIEGSDPFDYSGGYELDGMPVSESQLRHMLDRGTAVAGLSVNGNPRGFWDFTGNGNWGLLSGGFWMSRFGSTGDTARASGPPDSDEVGDPVPGGETSIVPFEMFTSIGFRGMFFMGLRPQNTEVLTVDPNGIRNALDRMLRIGDCGQFVEGLINRLGASTKNPFVSDYALDLFDAVADAKKGGFIRGGLANKNRVGATVSGDIRSGNAAIHLTSHFNGPPVGNAVNFIDAFQTLHELVHHAGSKRYYNDQQIAQTLSNWLGIPGLPVRSKGESLSEFTGRNSTYFSNVLSTKCPVLSR